MRELANFDYNAKVMARLHGDSLGSLRDVVDTLDAINKAYNSFVLFNISIRNPQLGREICTSNYLSDFHYLYYDRIRSNYIIPEEELILSKVSFNSPGFWEVFGSLNPLVQIREYLNDRHKRKKDKLLWESESAKIALENQKLELENQRLDLENQKLALQNTDYSIEISLKKLTLMKEVLAVLKETKCPEDQIRKFTNSCISVFKEIEQPINEDRITDVELI